MSFDTKTSTVPVNGTNEVQQIAIGGTLAGGTFQLKFGSRISSVITWSSTNATLIANIQAALDSLFGSGNTLVAIASLTAGVGTINVTFQASLGALAQAFVMTAISALTGTNPTVAVAQTIAGVTATHRNAAPGERIVYTGANPPVIYENVSSASFNPQWIIRDTNISAVSAASGTIGVPKGAFGTSAITYNGGAGAYTLTAPTAGTDDGKVLRLYTETAQAHVFTCTDGFNAKGSSGTATLAAAKGNGLALVARNGHWWVITNINATIA